MDFEKERKELVRIHNFIRDKYPKSCIAKNEQLNGFCPDNIVIYDLIKECSDFFLYEILGFCGCGCPETSMESVCDYLDIVDLRHTKSDDKLNRYENSIKARKLMQDKFNVRDVYSDPLLQYMAYSLDDAGLTEHGSSIDGKIRFGYITDIVLAYKFLEAVISSYEEVVAHGEGQEI